MRILCNLSESINYKSIIDYHFNKQYSLLPSWGEDTFGGSLKAWNLPMPACLCLSLTG